jgi:hypothetical protein
MKIANVRAADADSDMEGPRIILLGELNDLGLRDKIGASLAAVTDFDVFKISAGHRSILHAHTKGWHKKGWLALARL